MYFKLLFCSMLLSAFIIGCQTADQHQAYVNSAVPEKQMTMGVVQKEIREGMQQSEVLKALGSPNIVTRDSDGTETWGYDKVSTDTVVSKDSGGVNILILGYSAQSGAKSTRQRTLTVIIKFKGGVVDEFSYHSSSF